jgi:hypothetical protein
MLSATIYRRSKAVLYETLGEVIWNGREIPVDPDDDPDLNRLAVQPYWLSTSEDTVEEFNRQRW